MSRTLTGSKVELTSLREDDVGQLFDWINDRELVLLSSPFKPVDESDHRAWFDAVRSRDDVVIFAIRAVADGHLLGSCQLLAIDPRHRTAQLQIRIGAEADRGHGLGTEAVGLLLEHAFADLDLHRVELHVFATNAAAIRSYEKSGFRREGLLREAVHLAGERTDVVVMAILQDEWRERAAESLEQ
jgi:RimJ/RimL family protein N-acetyltransferase